MKRSRLQRRAWLGRRTPLRARRAKPRREERERDPSYLEAVRRLPCSVRNMPNAGWCWGPTDPHHAGPRRGMRLTCDDRQAIPACRGHHDDIHDLTGPFKGWNRAQMLEWRAARIAETQRTIDASPVDVGKEAIPW